MTNTWNLLRLMLVLTLSALVLSGCPASMSGAAVTRDQARSAQDVDLGTVVTVREVLIEGTGSGIGALSGAALGGIAGSFLAGRVGQGNPVAAYAVALVTLATTLVLIFGLGVSHSLIMVLMFLNGLSQLYAWLTIIHVLARVTPAPQGATMVINGSMLGIGGAAGATLGGLVIVPWGYEVLGMLYPAALVLSAAVFATLRDKISD